VSIDYCQTNKLSRITKYVTIYIPLFLHGEQRGDTVAATIAAIIVTTVTGADLVYQNRKDNYTRQEAPLSQRDRETLRVIEYFAKPLKVTQDHSK